MGKTPKGIALYREAGTDRYFKAVPLKGSDRYASVHHISTHRPIGAFKKFSDAVKYVDGTTDQKE